MKSINDIGPLYAVAKGRYYTTANAINHGMRVCEECGYLQPLEHRHCTKCGIRLINPAPQYPYAEEKPKATPKTAYKRHKGGAPRRNRIPSKITRTRPLT